jgi:hypothetical protein
MSYVSGFDDIPYGLNLFVFKWNATIMEFKYH